MKRFVLRSALFVGIIALVFGSICIAELGCELKAYRREIQAPVTASVLLCNDSQLQMSVDPEVEPCFFNFCAAARTMDQAYLQAIDILGANSGRIKMLVIDLSPIAAVDDFDQPLSKMGYAAQYYLLHWLHPDDNIRDLSGDLAVFRDNMVGRRWRLFWRSLRGRVRFTSSINGHFLAEQLSLPIMRPEDFRRQWEARARQFNAAPVVTTKSPIFSQVDRLVRLARDQGVEPVIVTTPLHGDLTRGFDSKKFAAFESAVITYARDRGCRYVNLMRTDLPDDCWYDAQHLNVKGARIFTPRLKAALAIGNMIY